MKTMKTLKVTLKYSLNVDINDEIEGNDALRDIQKTAEKKLREWLNDDFSTIEVDDDIEVEVPEMDEASTETTKNHQQQLFDLLPPHYQHLAELPDEICESLSRDDILAAWKDRKVKDRRAASTRQIPTGDRK